MVGTKMVYNHVESARHTMNCLPSLPADSVRDYCSGGEPTARHAPHVCVCNSKLRMRSCFSSRLSLQILKFRLTYYM